MATLRNISQHDVDVFCRRAAALNKSEKAQKKLRTELLDWMLANNPLPELGPWLIELSQNGGKEAIAWKEEYTKLYAKWLRSQQEYTKPESLALAQAHVVEMEKEQPDKEKVTVLGKSYIGGVKFNTKVNPNFKRKSVAA
jgi:hypothetical protein